jgi:hypothetical protein
MGMTVFLEEQSPRTIRVTVDAPIGRAAYLANFARKAKQPTVSRRLANASSIRL